MSLFVDNSIWYSAADSSDRSNTRSKEILKSGETLVTSDHVLVETWTLLHHKLERKAAERFWEGLRSGIAAIETVTLADLEVAWEIGVSWRDRHFVIVDRTGFAVMRRLGIDRVASLMPILPSFALVQNAANPFISLDSVSRRICANSPAWVAIRKLKKRLTGRSHEAVAPQ